MRQFLVHIQSARVHANLRLDVKVQIIFVRHALLLSKYRVKKYLCQLTYQDARFYSRSL